MKPMFDTAAGLRRLGAVCAMTLLLAACGGGKPESMVASAKEYLAKNDAKAAVIQLKNALQEKPDMAEARFLLGKALLQSGDVVGAETELRKALGLKHPADEVVPPLVQAMVALRQYKKITDEFSATALTGPQAQASLKTNVAAAYVAQGNPGQSKTALDAALAADPKYAPALLVRARTEATLGNIDPALGIVESVLAAAPDNFEALKMRGDLKLFGKQDEEGAAADFRKAVAIRPTYLDAHAAMLSMHLRKGVTDEVLKDLEALKKVAPTSFQARYFDTLVAFQKKDLPRARELAQQLIRVAPNSVLALQLAGSIELQAGGLLQADVHLNKALQAAPDAVGVRRQLANVYLRAGQVDKALATLQPLIRSADADTASNTLIGQAYLQSGDAKKAEEYFTKASKQDPSNANARIAVALSHLAGGRAEAGLDELGGIAAVDKGTTADMALISAHLRRQEFDKALRAIDVLEKKLPQSPMPANLRGRTLMAKKDMVGARKSFERSLQLDGDYFASLASLAALDLADKKPDEARKRFEDALQRNPKNAQALIALAELKARTGGSTADVAQLLARAIEANPSEKTPRMLLIELHLRNKDLKQALATAQAGVAAIPDSAELLDALGQVQQASGDTNQALSTFNKAAAMQTASPLPQMRLASLHLATKNKDAAAQSLRKALDIKPDFLDAQLGLVAMALDGRNTEEALRVARTVQKQRPKEDVGYRMEGDVAMSQKNWDGAIAAYGGGLKLVPSPVLAVKLHGAYIAADKKPEAEKLAATWLKDHPKDPTFRLALADAAIVAKDYAGAEKWYQAVLQIQPNNAVAYNNMAWVAGQQKKDTAVGYAEKAIALAPNQPAFIDTLAMLLLDKNEQAKAVELQKKALALQPGNPLFMTNMAKIYIKGGQKDLARKELEEVAKMGDKYQGQAEVSALLKSL